MVRAANTAALGQIYDKCRPVLQMLMVSSWRQHGLECDHAFCTFFTATVYWSWVKNVYMKQHRWGGHPMGNLWPSQLTFHRSVYG